MRFVLFVSLILGASALYWYIEVEPNSLLGRAFHDFRVSSQQQESPVRTTTVYKSTDASGQVQYSDQAAKIGENKTAIQYRSDSNVIPALPAQKTVQPTNSQPLVDSPVDLENPLLLYTQPQRVKQLIEDAKGVDKLLQDRQSAMEQQLE